MEYRVRKSLRQQGWVVVRAGQSKGPIDLVAGKDGIFLFIQCKRGGVLSPLAWNLFYEASCAAGAVPVMVQQGSRKQIWWRLTGRKDLRGRQPMVAYVLPEPSGLQPHEARL